MVFRKQKLPPIRTLQGFIQHCFSDVTAAPNHTLDNYAADYTVEVYSAQDGKQLDATTLSLPADDCPSMHYFSVTTENNYPDYKQPLIDFLKPYIQK